MPTTIERAKPNPLIRDSAYHIWLAGLGALSLAEDESGKLFNALVKRGKTFEGSTKHRIEGLRAKLDVRKAADMAVTRIGDTLDEGVSDVLHRLGLPTKKEIEGLTKRVERLTKTLEAAPPRSVRSSRRAGAKRRAAKPASVATV